jgi:hypothetical protein
MWYVKESAIINCQGHHSNLDILITRLFNIRANIHHYIKNNVNHVGNKSKQKEEKHVFVVLNTNGLIMSRHIIQTYFTI